MNPLDKLWAEVDSLAKLANEDDEYERGCRETAELILTMIEEHGGCDPAMRKCYYRLLEGHPRHYLSGDE